MRDLAILADKYIIDALTNDLQVRSFLLEYWLLSTIQRDTFHGKRRRLWSLAVRRLLFYDRSGRVLPLQHCSLLWDQECAGRSK